MKGWVAAAVFAAMSVSVSVQARDWPDAGGYEIVEGDEYCILTSEYKGPGESRLIVALQRSGGAVVMVDNYNWSSKKDEKYEDIRFELNASSYGGGTAHGTESSGRNGFIIAVDHNFMKDFAASTYFHVYKGDQVIDRLDLAGSAAAVASVRRCVAYVDGLRSAEERERKKYEDLPADPFAKKPK